MIEFKRPPPEGIRLINQALGWGIWAGSLGSLIMLVYFNGRWAMVPDITARFTIIGTITTLLGGTLGYLFWAGVLLKEK
jgi:hypothetical protein